MSRIGVIGSGYVGTVLSACLASLGHDVIAFERDPERLQMLRTGSPYFYEENLPEVLAVGIDAGRLEFAGHTDAVSECDVLFLCVGTPPRSDGYPDMRAVKAVAEAIGPSLTGSTVLVLKSTVPIGSGSWLLETLQTTLRSAASDARVSVVSNPEFLREGNAVQDFLHPARIVLGSADDNAIDAVLSVYQPLVDQSFEGGDPQRKPHVIRTDHTTAEMIKYASNAFLAGKISFINEIARISEHVGSDVVTVSEALGFDPRIGPHFLAAGVGWGGSCFGKDLQALMATARDHHVEVPMMQAIAGVNEMQRTGIVERLRERLETFQGRRIAILGLAFKPGTDDTRDSPAVAVAAQLLETGAEVIAYDPMVKQLDELPGLLIADDPYSAVQDSSAVVLLTDWPEFAQLDLSAVARSMSGSLVVDGRNMLDRDNVAAAGLDYVGIGVPNIPKRPGSQHGRR
ncbi:MAG: UDP-glucose/GDP-mannose dehydrogenase family protein [Acidimicrobiia bacterium]|nr:UDP-glucose/GDP-mannose dehydrogenase family protein [Acidimicrobiia bacterium]